MSQSSRPLAVMSGRSKLLELRVERLDRIDVTLQEKEERKTPTVFILNFFPVANEGCSKLHPSKAAIFQIYL